MIFSFAGFELDEEAFELRRAGEPVKLEPRVLELLLYLIHNRERVVPKDELIEKVWGVKFVSESALHHAIQKARQVLADAPDEVIKTVHGRGFRFVAPVQKRQRDPSDVLVAPPELATAPVPAPPVPRTESSPAPSRPTSRRRWLVAAAAVLAVGIGASLSSVLSRNRAPEGAGSPWYVPGVGAGHAPVLSSALKQLTSERHGSVKPSFSPDGKVILYGGTDPGSPGILDIYVMPAAGGTVWRLTERIGASGDMPVFSADGGQIFFSRWRSGEDGTRYPDLWSVGSFGGKPRVFLTEAHGAGFSHDGKWIAYTKYLPSKKALWMSPVRNVAEHREVAEVGFVPRFSPDGRWLAYTTSNPEGGEGNLFIVSTSTFGEKRRLTREPVQMYGLTWRPDGSALIFAARSQGGFHLWQAALDSRAPVPLTGGVGDYTSPSCSPDGKRIIFAHGYQSSNLMLADPLTSEAKAITGDETHMWPRLSPEGDLVASVVRRPDSGDSLYLTEVATGKRTRLTDHPAQHPSWIDDQRVAYVAPAEGSPDTEIRVVSVGTGAVEVLTRFPVGAQWLAVAPGGRRLAVALPSPDRKRVIVLRDLDSSGDRKLAEGWQFEHLRFRPDGRAISWSGPALSSGSETNGVWMLELDKEKPVRLSRDGYEPAWSADSRTIYFSRIGDFGGLWKLELSSGAASKVHAWRYVTFHDLVGNRLVYTQPSGPHQVYEATLSF